MTRSRLLLTVIAVLLFLSAGKVNAQQWGLYTLYAPRDGSVAYLIDTNSNQYHSWTFLTTKKTKYSTHLTKGDTLVRAYKPTANTWNVGPCHGGFQKVLWDGTVAWDYTYYSNGSYSPHHDILPMPNGNLMIICLESKSSTQSTQAGCTSAITLYAESLLELKPTGTNSAVIVWEWHLWDHLCQNTSSSYPHYVTSFVNNPQMLNINYTTTGTNSDRWHMNGIDYNEELDQITMSMHFMNQVFVIDHSTTTAEAAGHTGGNSGMGGDFLYRWGNPASYGASGSTNFDVVHDAHWVPSDNPLYPNYLVGYNNDGPTGSITTVDIWSPPYNGYNYTIVPGSAYGPTTYNYRYTSVFHATNEGNSQQLPNGNMMVNNAFGSIYEVNSAGTTLWTKTSALSSHAYRYSLCYVRGPMASATASQTTVAPGTPITLGSSATSVTETSPSYTYSWSSSPAGFSSTAQNPSASPTTTTTYTVVVTNSTLGCTDTATITVDVILGMDDGPSPEKLFVAPNPSSGMVYLQGEYVNEGNFTIELYTPLGDQVMRRANATNLDMSELNDGYYFLVFSSPTAGRVTKKLVLMR
jgi:hypothetical protein